MRPTTISIALCLLFVPAIAFAQPSVDIHLLEFERLEDGSLSLGAARNITDRPGYDNQPAFLPDGSGLLFTAMYDTLQSDIYRFDLESEQITRVTDTPESEYSPTPMGDGTRFSTVRVEMDQAQRLWSLDLQGGDAQLLLPAVAPVGYHAWGPENRLALFVLGDPHALHLATVGPDSSTLSAGDIGRSLQPMPGGQKISFLQRRMEGEAEHWWIRTVNPADGTLEDLVAAPEGAVDHAWSPWGSIFMTAGSVLWEWAPGSDGWTQRADLSGRGLEGLTRLAFHPARGLLALVATEPAGE